ncbi:hypothetical protein IEO21_10351 [Rhodonia placenta]|uniref:BTB domain-containing protein n=1 Tax=Rhodonia placenta TaxID=104341 RepID=A0A8H7NSS0_9APHY|nr:hypothetical protein IEO21_10351 [Postia placenta]
MSGDSPVIRTAAAPFDDATNTDVIVRTSDAVDFYVDKFILSKASAFFRVMFTLPQGPNAPDQGTVETDKPVVEVTEPSAVWEQLMRVCYAATAFAPPEGIDYIWPLIEAARKYQMDGVRSVVSQALLSADALENHTMRVYTLACAYELEDVARMAARYTLRLPLHSIAYRLLEYHRECGRVASTFITDVHFLKGEWVKELWRCVFFHRGECVSHSGTYYTSDLQPARAYLIAYMKRSADALKIRPYPPCVAEFSIMAPSIQEASSCTTCSPSVIADMARFAKAFGEEIERRISKVRLIVEP